jgi:hypothetical protein
MLLIKRIMTTGLMLCSLTATANCINADSVIGATYQVIDKKGGATREVTVLRQSKSRVFYLMPTDHITRLYEYYGQDMTAVTEYFDTDKLGVEYEPSKGSTPKGFSEVYQYLDNSELEQLAKVKDSQYQCLEVKSYIGTINGIKKELEYISQVKLPKSLTITRGDQIESRKLVALHTDKQLLNATLKRVNKYRTFDFADLGDHEDEDFFRLSKHLKYSLHGKHGRKH